MANKAAELSKDPYYQNFSSAKNSHFSSHNGNQQHFTHTENSVSFFGAPSAQISELKEKLLDFMSTHIYPNEKIYVAQLKENPWKSPPIMETLKKQAKELGLWNLFLPKGSKVSEEKFFFIFFFMKKIQFI
jgi:hypothetical protein